MMTGQALVLSRLFLIEHLGQGNIQSVPLRRSLGSLVPGIVIEARTAFDAAAPLRHNLGQQGIALFPVTQSLVEVLVDPVVRIQSAEIAHPEGAQRRVRRPSPALRTVSMSSTSAAPSSTRYKASRSMAYCRRLAKKPVMSFFTITGSLPRSLTS